MSSVLVSQPNKVPTLDDLVRQLGGVPLERIRTVPAPGTATEADLVELNTRRIGSFELVDCVLVEKAVAFFEASLSAVLITYLHTYLKQNNVGKVFSSEAMYRLVSGQIRLPDVSVIRRERFPHGKVERVAVSDLAFDLAVEILSLSNTKAEIDRKRREFFENGTTLMWVVDPKTHGVRVYTSPDEFVELTEDDVLEGGSVLPGFELSIRIWFSESEDV